MSRNANGRGTTPSRQQVPPTEQEQQCLMLPQSPARQRPRQFRPVLLAYHDAISIPCPSDGWVYASRPPPGAASLTASASDSAGRNGTDSSACGHQTVWREAAQNKGGGVMPILATGDRLAAGRGPTDTPPPRPRKEKTSGLGVPAEPISQTQLSQTW